MPEYLVRWEVHLNCKNPKQAAKEALAMQRDVESLADSFEVYETDEELRPVGEPIVIDFYQDYLDSLPFPEREDA